MSIQAVTCKYEYMKKISRLIYNMNSLLKIQKIWKISKMVKYRIEIWDMTK